MEAALYQTLSTTNENAIDDSERKNAVQLLKRHQRENYATNNQLQDHIRISAGLALKNSLSRFRTIGGILADKRSKQLIKSNILSLAAIQPKNVANVISQVVATLAIIDIPLGEGDDIIATLVGNITQQHQPSSVKQVALQTIGFICEIMKNVDCVLNLSRHFDSVKVKLAAVKSLYNSLAFIHDNFENNVERDFIIKVVCDAATPNSCSTIELQVAAYECLNKIANLYYDKLEDYMTSALYNANPSVVLQSIEFWSTICDIEITRKKENTMPMFAFADKFIMYILPTLLELLIKDKQRADILESDEDWDIHKSASHCLSLVACCCKELIIPRLIQFIKKNLLCSEQTDWNQKEAAIIAFGSILDGPSRVKMKLLVDQILPTIVDCMKHPNAHIRLAASWTLVEIIKESSQVLEEPDTLHNVISAVIFGLRDANQRISHNACLAIIHCAEDTRLSHNTTKTFDLQDDTFMATIYEAISTIIKHCKDDCMKVVQHVLESVISRLEILYSAETNIPPTFSIKDVIPLQSSLLGVLLSCVHRLADKVSVYASHIMELSFSILSLLQNEYNTSMGVLLEDIYLVCSAMIVALGPQFHCYVDKLIPYISNIMDSNSIHNHDHHHCLIGVGIISDLSYALPNTIKTHGALFLELLLNTLKNERLHKDIKPATISCFGDVALALGSDVLPYINVIMMILQQAGNAQPDRNDKEMVNHVDAIRVSTIEAFVGMLQGLSQESFTRDIFLTHVHGFMLYVHCIAKDTIRSDALNQAILGLLGDVARIYRDKAPLPMLESVLQDLTIETLKGGTYFSSRTQEMAQWAEKLEEGGYDTLEQVKKECLSSLTKELEMNKEEAQAVGKPGVKGDCTAKQKTHEWLAMEIESSFTTAVKNFDRLLVYGISPKKITEICGESGTGKTQLCMQMAVTIQLPKSQGGSEGECVYIDTEGSFSASRIQQIAERFDLKDPMKGIHVFRVLNYTEFVAIIMQLTEILINRTKVKLVIIDSMAYHLRVNTLTFKGRNDFLNFAGLHLIKIAKDLTVSVSNFVREASLEQCNN
ncbi:hypothetical protein [Parasitella parasitica]|uniref:RecA family profile 1 domain-containing protein n=1 Tax=Parasitella parasitica TaxID=35722 RepID=A0A0B7MV13_9FUNG|nr:hypothetical protein [Parasitella parasitica]